MKIIIRSSELAYPLPTVIAFYPDSSDISPDAHGENMTLHLGTVTCSRI